MTRSAQFFLLLLTALLTLSAPPLIVSAADIAVTEAADTSLTAGTSLREAVASANAGDRLLIQTGAPLTLDSQITIDKTLTIQLNGQSITATGPFRLFNVTGAGGLTVRNGALAGGGAGNPVAGNGGILTTAGPVLLETVTVRNGNAIIGGGAHVGGGGRLETLNVTFETNQAGAGGGVFVDSGGQAILRQTTIQNNTIQVNGSTPLNGAGVASEGALVVQGGGIRGNSGAGRGGGIYSSGSSFLVTDSLIQNNSAIVQPGAGEYAAGGGVWLSGGATTALLANSGVVGNTSQRGGGVYAANTLDLYNSTLDANNAADAGAALSDEGGGAVYLAGGSLVASFVTFSDNTAANADRAGIWQAAGPVYLKNSILANSGNNNCFSATGLSFSDQSGNIDSGATCGLGATSLTNTAPLLLAQTNGVRPLQESGPPSPALNVVTDCTTSNQGRATSDQMLYGPTYGQSVPVEEDQRRAPRTPLNGNCDIGAYEAAVAATPGVNVEVTSSVAVLEDGSNFMTYTLRLASEPAAGQTVTVRAVPDAQLELAFEGVRYTSAGGPLLVTFDTIDWAQARTVRVYGAQDTLVENDPHPGTVTHTVDATTTDPNYPTTLAVANLVISVRDDDNPRVVTVNNVSGLEGSGTFNFTIALEDNGVPIPAGETVDVTYTTVAGTAIAGQDFTATSDTVSFLPGETTKSVLVTIVNDDLAEQDETFTLQIAQVRNARIGGTGIGSGRIIDDDQDDSVPVGVPNEGIIVLPETTTLPTGRVGAIYETQFSATGGTPPYGLYGFNTENNTTFVGDWTLDTATGRISGTTSEPFRVEFTVVVFDSNLEFGRRTYTLEVTLTGEPSQDAAAANPTPVPTSTPISQADIDATQVAVVRGSLGPPVVEIDPRFERSALYVYSGPASGATIINIARADREYAVVGQYRPPRSQFVWYLIEYELPNPLADDLDVEIDESATPIPARLERGWVYSEFLLLSGYVLDIPTLRNPFDSVATGNTGLTGRTTHKNNIYRYPTPNSAFVSQFDEGVTFQILGRTKVDQRNLTNWLLVRLDVTGQVGWLKYTPFIEVSGDMTGLPTY